ncbi:hypothetical protein D9619_009836 [Psilocybe cf. subviscida]|uniref:Uncharacterized protein n=1 Tax=Psilocybe cf. subviscida TaxID=2480587 RepID=A0A8H5F5Z0_9AGAR|nr:hypothetical protein D9619_009836 [Psilocybe cf. subviscida]
MALSWVPDATEDGEAAASFIPNLLSRHSFLAFVVRAASQDPLALPLAAVDLDVDYDRKRPSFSRRLSSVVNLASPHLINIRGSIAVSVVAANRGYEGQSKRLYAHFVFGQSLQKTPAREETDTERVMRVLGTSADASLAATSKPESDGFSSTSPPCSTFTRVDLDAEYDRKQGKSSLPRPGPNSREVRDSSWRL